MDGGAKRLDAGANICSMGDAGSYVGSSQAYLSAFLERRDYHRALAYAFEAPRISLSDALRLTVLAARQDRDRFERMAQRFLIRFIDEKSPTLGLIHYVASDLDRLGLQEPPGFDDDAETRLMQVAEKL